MKAEIVSRHKIPLPSASAIEAFGDKLLIVGDDSSKLLALNLQRKKIGELVLFKAKKTKKDGRIPKRKKPDLEASAIINPKSGSPKLLILGSGSRRKFRDKAFVVALPRSHSHLTNKLTKRLDVQALNLTRLYDRLRALLSRHCKSSAKLNIEAATVAGGRMILLHRGGNSSPSASFEFNLHSFCAWIERPNSSLPQARIRMWRLPKLGGVASGFSGATTLGDTVYFLAAAEETSDPVLDGKVTGTFFGLLSFSGARSGVPRTAPLTHKGKVLPLKLESLTAIRKKAGRLELLAVSDDDLGSSELLKIRVTGI